MLQWTLSMIVWFLKFYLLMRLYKGCRTLVHPLFVRYIQRRLWPVNLADYADKWVVSTGCTDGIGKAYTVELARRGLRKFFLIGRNQSKLNTVTDILKTNYNCEVEYRVFDFKDGDLNELPEELSTYDIGILVNFVGTAVDRPLPLQKLPKTSITDIIKVNTLGQAAVLEAVLPGMFARDCGVVVTMSSIRGWRPLPQLSAYPASKAAASFLSKCLSMENRHTNVKFQCLVPMLIATKMTGYRRAERSDGWLVVNCDDYVRQAVDMFGQMDITTGCLQHDLQAFVMGATPFWLISKGMRFIDAEMDRRLVAFHKSSG